MSLTQKEAESQWKEWRLTEKELYNLLTREDFKELTVETLKRTIIENPEVTPGTVDVETLVRGTSFIRQEFGFRVYRNFPNKTIYLSQLEAGNEDSIAFNRHIPRSVFDSYPQQGIFTWPLVLFHTHPVNPLFRYILGKWEYRFPQRFSLGDLQNFAHRAGHFPHLIYGAGNRSTPYSPWANLLFISFRSFDSWRNFDPQKAGEQISGQFNDKVDLVDAYESIGLNAASVKIRMEGEPQVQGVRHASQILTRKTD